MSDRRPIWVSGCGERITATPGLEYDDWLVCTMNVSTSEQILKAIQEPSRGEPLVYDRSARWMGTVGGKEVDILTSLHTESKRAGVHTEVLQGSEVR